MKLSPGAETQEAFNFVRLWGVRVIYDVLQRTVLSENIIDQVSRIAHIMKTDTPTVRQIYRTFHHEGLESV